MRNAHINNDSAHTLHSHTLVHIPEEHPAAMHHGDGSASNTETLRLSLLIIVIIANVTFI